MPNNYGSADYQTVYFLGSAPLSAKPGFSRDQCQAADPQAGLTPAWCPDQAMPLLACETSSIWDLFGENRPFCVLVQVFGEKWSFLCFRVGIFIDPRHKVAQIFGICAVVDLIALLSGVGTYILVYILSFAKTHAVGREKANSEKVKPRLRSCGLRFSSRG